MGASRARFPPGFARGSKLRRPSLRSSPICATSPRSAAPSDAMFFLFLCGGYDSQVGMPPPALCEECTFSNTRALVFSIHFFFQRPVFLDTSISSQHSSTVLRVFARSPPIFHNMQRTARVNRSGLILQHK